MRCVNNFHLAFAVVCVFAGGLIQAGEVQLDAKPGPALKLHLTSASENAARVGPAPVSDAGGLTWKAAGLLCAAKGAISVRVRTRPVTNVIWMSNAKRLGAQTICSLANTGGGELFLNVYENPRVESKKAKPPKAPTDPPAEAALDEPDLADDAKAVGALVVLGCSKVRPAGMDNSVSVWRNLTEAGTWHHIVWTWESVNHKLYIDGKPAAADRGISRMLQLQNPEAVFRVHKSPAEIQDLRVYSRALSDAEVAALAGAKADQYLSAELPLRVSADWGRFTGRAVVYADTGAFQPARLDVNFVDAAGKSLRKLALTSFPDGLGEQACWVLEREGPFAPGVYHVEAEAFAADGASLGKARSEDWTAKPLDKPYSEYIGCRVGEDEKKVAILPPFTPITADGANLGVSLRQYKLDRSGLPASIVAAGEELLASPVALQLVSGGKEVAFTQGDGLSAIANKKAEADWAATTTSAEGHRLEVRGHLEYDGVARFDVRLVPAAALKVDALDLRLPLRQETLRLVHSSGTTFFARFAEVTRTPEGAARLSQVSWSHGGATAPARPESGAIFDSYFNAEAAQNPEKVCGFIHVGNYQRGLSWFIDNDLGWVHRPGVPNMELIARPNEQYVSLHVVARETQLSAPLEFRFYLLANPFKPLPKDWRTWSYGNRRQDKLQQNTSHMWWWLWAPYSSQYKPYPDNYESWRDKFKQDAQNILNAPFINFGTPGGSGLFLPDAKVEPFTWKLHNHRAHRDYVAYWMNRCIHDLGIKGVYVDEPYCEFASTNVLASEAPYIAADGTRHVGFRWMEGRAYFRRLKQVFVDNGIVDNGGVWAHTTHWKGFPYFTFIDVSMDGEWPQIWVTSFHDYVGHYHAGAMNRGYIAGQAYGFVGMQMCISNSNPKDYPRSYIATRTYLGVTLPYNVVPFEPVVAAEWRRLHNIQYEAGIFDHDDLDDIPLVEKHDGLCYGGFVNRKRDSALLYVQARDACGAKAVDDIVQRLPLKKPARQAWQAETGASLLVDGKLQLTLDHHDYAPVLVRTAEAPQVSRPAGKLLAVSFDKDAQPEYGAGIVPLEISGNLVFKDGKSGKALAVAADAGSVRYPLVLSAASGAIEFDLRVSAPPARLVSLRHCLNLDLDAVADEAKKTVLRLSVLDNGASHTASFPLPEPAAWSRIRLAWRAGHYEVSCNDKKLGEFHPSAAPLLQDDAFPAYGLIFGGAGGGGGGGEALIDSVVVSEHAGDGKELSVWLWGKPPEFTAAVNFADQSERFTAERVRFTVLEGAKPLASAEAVSLHGCAQTTLISKVKPTPAGDVAGKKDELALDDGPQELQDGPAYVVAVELLRGPADKPVVVLERKVNVRLTPGPVVGKKRK